jgi:hypothetical protein
MSKDVVVRFHKLFHILASKLLLPYYKAMNSEFFNWIDEVNVG